MFTGIIEAVGTVTSVQVSGTNRCFWISSSISDGLKPDQSVSHSGVCLTVEEVNGTSHKVTAIEETLNKTNLADWKPGTLINMERCLQMNGRLDGHIVQGHVDTTAICIDKKDNNGSWEYRFMYPGQFDALVIEKGSISLNGISLTIFNVCNHTFSVAIIPYTYQHTSIQQVYEKSLVNIEFDMIGKYVNKIHATVSTI